MPIAQVWKPPFSSNTQYVGVSTNNGDDSSPDPYYEYEQQQAMHNEVNLQSHPQLKGKRSCVKTLLIQSFCLLWILPIGLLLFLNIKGWIIGATAWCPTGKCYTRWFDPVSSVPQALMARYDHNNHNLLGALQLVAKALEVWFILVATWLVYLVTMFLASRKYGLPVAYILRPSEFAELPNVWDPLLWRTLPKPFRGSRKRKARLRVWIFVLFTVFLGLICNLMGPAVAVLVIPSLQWLTTEDIIDGVFVSQNSQNPPMLDGFLASFSPNCTEEHFNNSMWSCTATPWASILDSWLDSYTASIWAADGISQQTLVSFGFNSTEWVHPDGTIYDYLSWAPNRRVMAEVALDVLVTEAISLGWSKEEVNLNPLDLYDTYTILNSTVAAAIQRNGPVNGIASNMWLGYDNATWWDTVVEGTMQDVSKAIRCYENYNVSNTPLSEGILQGIFTKCVKWGNGWNNGYSFGTFTIDGVYKPTYNVTGPSAMFEIWTSDVAAFLPNGELPPGFSADCLPRGAVVAADVTCDWDSFFLVDSGSPMASRSINVNTIQISTEYAPEEGHPTSLALMFDFIAYQNFTWYSLDVNRMTNPLWLTTTPGLPTGGNPILVDPSWTLAAWSADDGGNMVANRSAALAVLHAFDVFWESDYYNSPNPIGAYYPYIDYLAIVPIVQTLSLVDYSFTNSTETPTVAISADNPQLVRNARINVWAYGLSSRTSYLGLLVTGIGVIIVVFQTLLGLIDRRPYRSPTELLVAALEHAPSEEFMGSNHDERAIARTPFRVEDWKKGHASHFKFEASAQPPPQPPRPMMYQQSPPMHHRSSSSSTTYQQTPNMYQHGPPMWRGVHAPE